LRKKSIKVKGRDQESTVGEEVGSLTILKQVNPEQSLIEVENAVTDVYELLEVQECDQQIQEMT